MIRFLLLEISITVLGLILVAIAKLVKFMLCAGSYCVHIDMEGSLFHL